MKNPKTLSDRTAIITAATIPMILPEEVVELDLLESAVELGITLVLDVDAEATEGMS